MFGLVGDKYLFNFDLSSIRASPRCQGSPASEIVLEVIGGQLGIAFVGSVNRFVA
jgi:hypothetical protein